MPPTPTPPSSLFAADDTHAPDSAGRTPVFVLTGFLGSGKTTLLNRLLRDPALADTAVLINEVGAVALDHLLVERLDGEVAVLKSGCICCAVRGDFETALRELLARRDEGSVPAFARVVIETTGLADPAPLVQAVDANPLLAHFCRLGAVLTTLDAVHGVAQLERQWEARKQLALADRVLLTKTDLMAGDDAARAALHAAIDALNPHAERIVPAAEAAVAPWLAPVPVRVAVERALRPDDAASASGAAVGLLAGRPLGPLHGEVASFVLEAADALDWMALQAFLATLRARHGERLLRLKGIARVVGEAAPLVLHGVHHLFHPPRAAAAIDWPAGRTALVLIGRGLPEAELREAFAAVVAAPAGAESAPHPAPPPASAPVREPHDNRGDP